MEFLIRDAARRGDDTFVAFAVLSKEYPHEFWQSVLHEAVRHSQCHVVECLLQTFPELDAQTALALTTDSKPNWMLYKTIEHLIRVGKARPTADMLRHFVWSSAGDYYHPMVSLLLTGMTSDAGERADHLLGLLLRAAVENNEAAVKRILPFLHTTLYRRAPRRVHDAFVRGIFHQSSKMGLGVVLALMQWNNNTQEDVVVDPLGDSFIPGAYDVVERLVEEVLADASGSTRAMDVFRFLRDTVGIRLHRCPGILTTIARSGHSDAMWLLTSREDARAYLQRLFETDGLSALDVVIQDRHAPMLRYLLDVVSKSSYRTVLKRIVATDDLRLIDTLLGHQSFRELACHKDVESLIREAVARGRTMMALALIHSGQTHDVKDDPSAFERLDVVANVIASPCFSDPERMALVQGVVTRWTDTPERAEQLLNDAIRRRQMSVVRVLREKGHVPLPPDKSILDDMSSPWLWHARAMMLQLSPTEWAVGATSSTGMGISVLLARNFVRRAILRRA